MKAAQFQNLSENNFYHPAHKHKSKTPSAGHRRRFAAMLASLMPKKNREVGRPDDDA